MIVSKTVNFFLIITTLPYLNDSLIKSYRFSSKKRIYQVFRSCRINLYTVESKGEEDEHRRKNTNLPQKL